MQAGSIPAISAEDYKSNNNKIMQKVRHMMSETLGWGLLLLATLIIGYGGFGFVADAYKACTADPLDINRDGKVNLTDTSVYFVKVQE